MTFRPARGLHGGKYKETVRPQAHFTKSDADRMLGLADVCLGHWKAAAAVARDERAASEYLRNEAEWAAIRPLLAEGPTLLRIAREALSAMQLMRDQLDALAPSRPSKEFKLTCETHEETKADIHQVIYNIAANMPRHLQLVDNARKSPVYE